MKNQALALKQLDKQFSEVQKLKNVKRPLTGWIRTIRKALGMTTQQLATRAGVHRMRVVQLEKAELEDAVTLRSLRAIAKEMECELVYAFVPHTSLQTILEEQAKKTARAHLQHVTHSMVLENQAVYEVQTKEQENELTKKLLEGNLKHIWNK